MRFIKISDAMTIIRIAEHLRDHNDYIYIDYDVNDEIVVVMRDSLSETQFTETEGAINDILSEMVYPNVGVCSEYSWMGSIDLEADLNAEIERVTENTIRMRVNDILADSTPSNTILVGASDRQTLPLPFKYHTPKSDVLHLLEEELRFL
ncbi:uncharacterized protein Ecym_2780 [Eremothecium cymbalariae DBVPG|uniref:Uncharacterized protein n=1 Tax=Eremothecium cymbalariae (strain CBS 270.75 / DBVPG 7215 / KCTC 17166 / NRRL Y-17582) TaxID=931890 RepID=G8JQ15_ERECY|nr:Hypothetical protein Ecym_2780 [Eremothecium cymbalariae DBVPG\